MLCDHERWHYEDEFSVALGGRATTETYGVQGRPQRGIVENRSTAESKHLRKFVRLGAPSDVTFWTCALLSPGANRTRRKEEKQA